MAVAQVRGIREGLGETTEAGPWGGGDQDLALDGAGSGGQGQVLGSAAFFCVLLVEAGAFPGQLLLVAAYCIQIKEDFSTMSTLRMVVCSFCSA